VCRARKSPFTLRYEALLNCPSIRGPSECAALQGSTAIKAGAVGTLNGTATMALRSMTGYGRKRCAPRGRLLAEAEARSVTGRYLAALSPARRPAGSRRGWGAGARAPVARLGGRLPHLTAERRAGRPRGNRQALAVYREALEAGRRRRARCSRCRARWPREPRPRPPWTLALGAAGEALQRMKGAQHRGGVGGRCGASWPRCGHVDAVRRLAPSAVKSTTNHARAPGRCSSGARPARRRDPALLRGTRRPTSTT
jgi:hypothetical protein